MFTSRSSICTIFAITISVIAAEFSKETPSKDEPLRLSNSIDDFPSTGGNGRIEPGKRNTNQACIRELLHFKLITPHEPLSRQPVPDRRACILSCLRRRTRCHIAVFYGKADSQICELYEHSTNMDKAVTVIGVDDPFGVMTIIFELLPKCPEDNTTTVTNPFDGPQSPINQDDGNLKIRETQTTVDGEETKVLEAIQQTGAFDASLATWRDWSEWTPCTDKCDGGETRRERKCANCPIDNNGVQQQIKRCNLQSCHVARFAVQYGEGPTQPPPQYQPQLPQQNQYQQQPQTQYQSQQPTQTQYGATQPTAPQVNANWGEWGAWSGCGSGYNGGAASSSETRSRLCIGASNYGGCQGSAQENKPCIAPQLDAWSEWSSYGACTATCGQGTYTRTRQCNTVSGGTGQSAANYAPQQANCLGQSSQTTQCQLPPCAQWQQWGAWSACSTTCGVGRINRQRQCSQGGGGYGGVGGATTGTSNGGCFGQNIESKACHQGACSMWSQWADWSTCSNSCGEGNSNRYRTCEPKNAAYRPLSPPYSPPPVSYNIPAPTQSSYTNAVPSPQYAVKALVSRRRLKRQYSNAIDSTTVLYQPPPIPSYGNTVTSQEDCPGSATEVKSCRTLSCEYWSEWGEWDQCSVTCGHGQERRYRQCIGGEEGRGKCHGPSSQLRGCNCGGCPTWTHWTHWARCNVKCGPGAQLRTRTCREGHKPIKGNCPNQFSNNDYGGLYGGQSQAQSQCGVGKSQEGRSCDAGACPTWGPWRDSSCSVTCGTGSITRTRTCSKLHPRNACEGERTTTSYCERPACCEWSNWVYWSACSSSCGQGQKTRTRQLINGPGVGAVSSYGQVTTSCGQSTQTQSCSSGPCCQWTGWQPWTACSATCGDGYKTRTQSCSCGSTGYGGINGGGSQCPGEVPAQQTNCNNAPCQTYVAPQVDAYQPQPPPQPTYQVPQPTYQPQPAVQQGYRLN